MQLSIGYINDVHGYLEPHNELFYDAGKEVIQQAGGYERIATLFSNIKEENPNALFFDGGDTFHGTLPLIIKQVGDIRIAVIGICCNIIDKTMPKHFSEGIKITDGMKELPEYIKKVKEEGADLIILLSHNGFPQDVEMLTKVPGVDICLSAHTHNRLYEAIKINNALLIQCGCHGSFVGHLKVNVQQKKITDYSYRLITVTEDINPDEEVSAMIEKIMLPYNDLRNEQVGSTEVLLHRYNIIEASMDNLLLTAMQSATNADIAFSNGWRYGVPVNKGAITKWDLYNIIPMNPPISTVELFGQEIIDMLEENLERTFSTDPMQQMGGYVKRCVGLNVKMRIENPKGNRIQEIYFQEKHLQKDKIYNVTFVTSQGVPEKLGRNRQELEVKAVDAMEQYLRKNGDFVSKKNNSISLV